MNGVIKNPGKQSKVRDNAEFTGAEVVQGGYFEFLTNSITTSFTEGRGTL